MRQRAFAEFHQLAIFPVSTDGEVRRVFLPIVEEVSNLGFSHLRVRGTECLADNSYKQAAVVYHVSCAMIPRASLRFPPSAHGLHVDTMDRGVLLGTQSKLHKRVGQLSIVRQPHARSD